MEWVLNWMLANVVWLLFFAIIVLAVAWVAASRARSDHWGHPHEFAGTMPDERPTPEERTDQAHLEGELTQEDLPDEPGHHDRRY